jgi:hypothetical protein
MPTIIDSLIVELNLDASKFDAAQKKSVESLRGLEDASAKHVKPVADSFDKLLTGFKEMQGRLLAIGAIIAGGLGLRGLVEDVAKVTAEIGRTSTALGMNTREFQKWRPHARGDGGKPFSWGEWYRERTGLAQAVRPLALPSLAAPRPALPSLA